MSYSLRKVQARNQATEEINERIRKRIRELCPNGVDRSANRRIKQATQKKKYPYDSLSGGSGRGGPPIPSAPFVSIAYPYYNDGSLEVASVQHSQTEESQERHDGFQTIEDHVYEEMFLPNSVTHKHALTCCSYLGIVLTSFMGALLHRSSIDELKCILMWMMDALIIIHGNKYKNCLCCYLSSLIG